MFDRGGIGDVDQIRVVLEEGTDKKVVVVRMHFRQVNCCFKFDSAYTLLGLEIP